MTALPEPRPWKAATLCLIALGALFFSSYNAANWLASQRAQVPSIVFAWESHVPYWPWTIVPYWSIDLFYCVSLFICRTRVDLTTQACRLLAVQLISVSVFVAAPLRCTFVRPETSGVFGVMLDALLAFDKPFNQAPALHISLLVILWVCFARRLRGVWRWLLHGWFVLIGISVMTTYQHQFFDIPTGAWTGFLCVWFFPDNAPGLLRGVTLTKDARARQLALRYFTGGLLVILSAITLGGAALWLLWVTASLWLVACNYLWFGAAGFQKGADGRMSLSSCVLFAPYCLGAWLNSRWWTRREPIASAVTEGVWIGRLPAQPRDLPSENHGIVDLCAELPCTVNVSRYQSMPALDLVVLNREQLARASRCITQALAQGPVLVCCALGYSRSAAAIVAWLITSGRASSVEAAIALVRAARPAILINEAQIAVLRELQVHE